jgi:hypothetical protein
MSSDARRWIARLLIGLVLAWNVQAALAFLIWPSSFAWAYELSGVPGEAAMRGVAVLFLMWNVPYVPALWHPVRYRLALVLAWTMQLVGLIGESFILVSLPSGHATLGTSVLRFILFDGAGLILLGIAWWLTYREVEEIR